MLEPQPARVTDVCDLLRLRDAAAHWMQQRQQVQWAPGEMSLRTFERQVTAGEWHVLRGDDGVVFAGLRLLWRDDVTWGAGMPIAGYVHGLVVDRDTSGRGYGAALLSWAGRQTLDRGRFLLRLDCVETNHGLRRYYRGRGFSEVGRRDFNSDRWHPVTLFERDLRDDESRRRPESPVDDPLAGGHLASQPPPPPAAPISRSQRRAD